MPDCELDQPFDSIESAEDFMKVLASAVMDVARELERERVTAGQDGEHRRLRALDLASYKVKLLGCHVHKSRRLLHDLGKIRRLLAEEPRTAAHNA